MSQNRLQYHLNQMIDEFVNAMFRRRDRILNDEKRLLAVHEQTLSKMEKQLTAEIADQEITHEIQSDVKQHPDKEKEIEAVHKQTLSKMEKQLTAEITDQEIAHEVKSESKEVEEEKEIDVDFDESERKHNHSRYNELKNAEGLSIERDEKTYRFEAVEKGELIFSDGHNKIQVDAKEVPMSAESRGKLEAIRYLNSLSKEDIMKNMKEVAFKAQKEDRPIAEVYREKLAKDIQKAVDRHQSKVLKRAVEFEKTFNKLKANIRTGEKYINEKIFELEKGKQEHRVSPEHYQEMTQKYAQDKERYQKASKELDQTAERLQQQLKMGVQIQYPSMNMDTLNLSETISIAKAARELPDGVTFRDYAKGKPLEETLEKIEKASEKAMVEITETLEEPVYG